MPQREREDLNVIFYGPPGTGKTYGTAELAVAIVDGEAPAERAETMKRYSQLREEGVIEFVTFHQAFSYEEFVEGIRPVLEDPEDDIGRGVQYACSPGVFRRLCERAATASTRSSVTVDLDLDRLKVWKMSLGSTLRNEHDWIFHDAIENGYVALGYGSTINFDGCNDREAIAARYSQERPDGFKDFGVQAVNLLKNEMSVGDLVVVSDGNTKFRAIGRISGEYQLLQREGFAQTRPVEWLLVLEESLAHDRILKKIFSQASIYQLRRPVLKEEALRELLSAKKPVTPKNHVLIIDEIYRGNIAKILGELITLIEPDKRVGAPNGLHTTLPYSGDEFGVPQNIYIIGTMNTADRSIALMDTALRRRFHFVEMMPDTGVIRELVGEGGVVDEVDVAELLRVMNQRIELLYDREHTIGHSYFLGCQTLDDVREAFVRRIVPLLGEYFFGDHEKICHVLGCPHDQQGRARNNHPILVATPLKASKLLGSSDDYDDRFRYRLNPSFVDASGPVLKPYFAGLIGGEASTALAVADSTA